MPELKWSTLGVAGWVNRQEQATPTQSSSLISFSDSPRQEFLINPRICWRESSIVK
jgi:hypothetical protein